MKKNNGKRTRVAKASLEKGEDVLKEYNNDLEKTDAERDVIGFIERELGSDTVGAVIKIYTNMIKLGSNLVFRDVDVESPDFMALKADIAVHGLIEIPQVYYSETDQIIYALNGSHRITACRQILEEAREVNDSVQVERFLKIPVRFVEEPKNRISRIDRQFKSNELRRVNSALDTAEYVGEKIAYLGGENSENLKVVSSEVGMDRNDVRRYLKIFKLNRNEKDRLKLCEKFLGKTIIKNAFKKSTSSSEKISKIFEELEDKLYKRTNGKYGKLMALELNQQNRSGAVRENPVSLFAKEMNLNQKEESLIYRFLEYQRSLKKVDQLQE